MNKTFTSRELFLSAANAEHTPRPPIWIMRQAGRFLPEYRKLKETRTFVELVRTPDLAAEVTLQPIRRFGFDCAIVFSDILVIPEALGIAYDFRETGGIAMRKTTRTQADIDALDSSADNIRNKLSYIAQTLKILRRELPNTALLGFCGAPWTLAAYMVEGGGSKTFDIFKDFTKNAPEQLHKLLKKLAEASAEYVKMQVECGIDGFQIFDSNAALAPLGQYKTLSANYTKEILNNLRSKAKSIFFANGMSDRFDEVESVGADVFSLNSNIKISDIRKRGEFAVQGNLDPASLSEWTSEQVRKYAKEICADCAKLGGHIFNLGHGIRPDAKLENVEVLVDTIKNFKA